MTRKLLGLFVGVPDEMLRSIGLIAVLSARLDFIRIQLLEAADQVPLTASANWPRHEVRKALVSAFSDPLFTPLYQQVSTWLEEGDPLFAYRDELMHSVGGYEVRGNGAARFIREHPRTPGVTQPQKTADELDTVVMALADATHEGVGLHLDTILLVEHGPEEAREIRQATRGPSR